MESRPVHLDRPPHSARLLAWGRGPFGWWGLITFHQPVRPRRPRGDSTPDLTAPDDLPVSVWVPASALRAPSWSSPVDVPKLALAQDQHDWPAPSTAPTWYAGPWVNGPLILPPGVDAVTGPAWRRRRR